MTFLDKYATLLVVATLRVAFIFLALEMATIGFWHRVGAAAILTMMTPRNFR